MFAWGFDTFLLKDEFFEWCAWGCGFQGLVCLGTSISAPLLLRDLLGVDLLGSVRQGYVLLIFVSIFVFSKFCHFRIQILLASYLRYNHR